MTELEREALALFRQLSPDQKKKFLAPVKTTGQVQDFQTDTAALDMPGIGGAQIRQH